jgi:hypothetical protein
MDESHPTSYRRWFIFPSSSVHTSDDVDRYSWHDRVVCTDIRPSAERKLRRVLGLSGQDHVAIWGEHTMGGYVTALLTITAADLPTPLEQLACCLGES